MTDKKIQWFKWITELQAAAQSGLTYCTNEFDIERYIKIREIAAQMAAECSSNTFEVINDLFSLDKGYATPKLDIRGVILKDKKLLLVRGRADGLWSLPGGWADVNESPSEAIAREVKEESGYEARVLRLLSLWDKLKHDHPLQWPHTYKCFFHCELTGGEARENLEVSEIDFFGLDHLPPLSTPRITEKQLLRLYELVHNSELTEFD